jgi:phosphatidylglycerol---prolipoprotein diacylglyceryl transferase
MHRLLIDDPRLGSYLGFLLCALAGGYLLARWRARRIGLMVAQINNVALLVTGATMVGTMFGASFGKGETFSWRLFLIDGTGITFYGWLLSSLIVVFIYARMARVALGQLLDAFAPGIALGLAIGRLGCFMAGCCWGDLCISPAESARLPSSGFNWQVRTIPPLSAAGFPWAVQFPRETAPYRQHLRLQLIQDGAAASRPVHPVQLYESTLALTLCFMLHRRFHRRRWPGQVACGLALGHAGIRFATEFLRADNSPVYWGFTFSQIVSLLIGAVALGLLVNRRVTPAVGRLQVIRISGNTRS